MELGETERKTNLGEILIDKATFCSRLKIFKINGNEDGDKCGDTMIDDGLRAANMATLLLEFD